MTAAQLATNHGWPVLLAVVAGGLVALPIGAVIGMLTIRLGDLYVALVTLTFGLLMDNLVFSRNLFLQQGLGVTLNKPKFVHTDKAFVYFALVVFCLVGLFIVNLRRSTTGMAMTGVRTSEVASRTVGVSIFQMKVIIAALGALVAGIGGSLLAMEQQATALPANFATLLGVVWLAVLVTQGIRSNMAALVAGLAFTIFPALVQAHLSPQWGNVPPILFGLGAVALAKNPDGVLVMQARQVRGLISRIGKPRPGTDRPAGVDQPGIPAGVGR